MHAKERTEKLTKREREILGLISQGLTDPEIAKELFISNHTVITHRKNLLNKLKLKNKVELAKFAIENNLTGQKNDPNRG